MTRALTALGSLATASLLLLSASSAHAACDEPAGRCGDGEGRGLLYSHSAAALSPTLGFNWTSGIYTAFGMDFRARAQLGLSFVRVNDPIKGGHQPIFAVDLAKAPVEATWSADTKRITLRRVEASSETARLDVNYTLRPAATIWLDGPPNLSTELFTYTYDANQIFSDLIGNENFNIQGQKNIPFAPWATVATTPELVKAGGIPSGNNLNSALFSRPWSIGQNPPTANGTFGVFVNSEPTFSYQTLTVKVGQDEVDDVVGLELPEQAEYGNSLKVPVAVHGAVSVAGSVDARPYLHVQQVTVAGFSWDINTTFSQGFGVLTHPVNVGAVPFDFPNNAEVEIPIPNVKLVQSAAEFTATAGERGEAKITLRNEGLAPAKLKFSADGEFTVSSATATIPAGGSFELAVRAQASEPSEIEGEVQIETNDPDSPFLKLTVSGNFVAPASTSSSGGGATTSSSGGSSGNPLDGEDEPAEDSSGCGCRTTHASDLPGGLASVGAGLFGLMAVLRRRRSR